jgi:rRNA maturation endonuclease Nob1
MDAEKRLEEIKEKLEKSNKYVIKKIDEMFKEEEDKINLQDLKIKADVLGTHFTNMYIISLRDDYNINEGKRQMLELIKSKIIQIVEGDK